MRLGAEWVYIQLVDLSAECLDDKGVGGLVDEPIGEVGGPKDEYEKYPVVHSMSAISGTVSIIIAAEYLSNLQGGKGVLLGGVTGITPTEVVIIGAGTAAEFAIRAALGLGAHIKVFDSSFKRGQPATFKANKVIKGWTEILQIMKVGSKYKIFVPPELGYGRRGVSQDIRPNMMLIFEIELLEIE